VPLLRRSGEPGGGEETRLRLITEVPPQGKE
jgi:hypothetical protein